MDFAGRLPDQFSYDLLAGSLLVAKEPTNPVRLHLAAAGLRELFGHISVSYTHLTLPTKRIV